MGNLGVRVKPPGFAPVSLALSQAMEADDGLLEWMPIGVFTCDAAGALVKFNSRCAQLWGHVLQAGERAPLTGDDLPVGRALRSAQPSRDQEISFDRPDGERRTLLASAQPLSDGGGQLIGAVGCFQDITERKDFEHRQRQMLHELNHRVKNTLSTVQSLAAHSLRGAGLERQAREAFEDRLMALSRAHEQLSHADWTSADLGGLVEGMLAPFGRDRARSQGPAVALQPRVALALALALHELTANAARYGALSTAVGQLDLDWTVETQADGRRLILRWTESGGPPVEPPARRGFGCRLLERGMGGELNGRSALDFDPSGLRCVIDIPLPAA